MLASAPSVASQNSQFSDYVLKHIIKELGMIDTINGATSSAIIYSIAETAKANNLKPYEYFEYLLTEIPAYMDDIDRSFLEDFLPWSPMLPEYIRNKRPLNCGLSKVKVHQMERLPCTMTAVLVHAAILKLLTLYDLSYIIHNPTDCILCRSV